LLDERFSLPTALRHAATRFAAAAAADFTPIISFLPLLICHFDAAAITRCHAADDC